MFGQGQNWPSEKLSVANGESAVEAGFGDAFFAADGRVDVARYGVLRAKR